MTVSLNLLPWREELKIQQKRQFITLLGLTLLAAVGLMLCIHLLVNRQIAFQNEMNSYIKAEISKLDQQIIEIQDLEKEKKQLLAKMAVIQQLQASRPQIVQLFDGIARILPPGMYLTNLARAGDRILIEGKAESNTRVSTFMRNIDATTWLATPELSLIQADEHKQGDKLSKVSDKLIGFNLQAIAVTLVTPNVAAKPTDTEKKAPGGANSQ